MFLECCLMCHLVCLQAFHTLYHTDENVLLGAPTGSGKTISAELTMLHAFNVHPGQKIIYVAPLKVGPRHRHFMYALSAVSRSPSVSKHLTLGC